MSISVDLEAFPNELLHDCKIASVHNGYLDLKVENLKKILDNALGTMQISGQIPVAFLSVIGPNGSGKSLFTNFIIEYLRSGCHGSWWTKVKARNDKQEPIGPGFSWGTVSHPGLFQPEGPLVATSGIYLWPEPFFLEKSDEKVLVWVLHLHMVENKQDDMRELEKFLMVVCSRVMEIQLETDIDNSFRILDHFRNILTTQKPTDPDSFTPVEMCNSIVYVIRSCKKSNITTSVTDEDSKAELLALTVSSSEPPVDKSLLDHFQHVNVTWMKESYEALHDANGIFFPQAMNTFKYIATIMVQESEMLEKKSVLKQSVTLEGMLNFLVTTANRLSTGKNNAIQDKLEHLPTVSIHNDMVMDSSPVLSPFSGSSISMLEDVVNHTFGRIPSQENMHVDNAEVEDTAEQMQIDVVDNQEEIQIPDVAELERQRREKEEEEARLRQQKANARLAMEQCVPIALTQLENMFLRGIERWILGDLNLCRINQWPPIYSLVLEVVLKEYSCKIDQTLHNEFKKQLDSQYQVKSQQFLKDLSEFITGLNDSFQNQFRHVRYFSQDQFNRVKTETLATINADKGGPFFKMAIHAANKLLYIYGCHNDLIIDQEAEFYNFMMWKATDVYKSEMERLMKHVPYRPFKLHIIHEKLKDSLINDISTACRRPNCDPDEIIETKLQLMKEDLDVRFLEYKERNSKTLKNMLAIATKIISSAKMEYNKGMEKLLDEYPKGIERTAFQVHHETMKRQVITMLEGKMRSDVRKEEPLEEHRKELESYITKYWPAVEAENEERLKIGQRNEESPQKREREETERNPIKDTEDRGTGELSFAGSSGANLQPPKTIEQELTQISLETVSTAKELPPLIFYLKSTRILMAVEVEGQSQIQRNEMGEEETPACLAVNQNRKEFVYGTEALALASSSNYDDNSLGVNSFWNIMERLLNGITTWSTSVNIGDISYHITLEFLLAFLLRKLKFAVEAQLNGQFSKAVVVVPFWLTSPQRVQVKDGVILAGFSNVYLMNEPSAAAYSMLLGDKSDSSGQEGKILVISENTGCINVMCYQYNTYCTKKLKMLNHEGHYVSGNSKHQALPKKALTKTKIESVLQAFKWFIGLFWGEQQPQNGQKEIKLKVRELCSKVIKKARTGRYRPDIFECLVICDDMNRCKDIFESVAREFGNTPGPFREDLAVFQGAGALSRNSEEIGCNIRDKPAFDLQLICGPTNQKIDIKDILLSEFTKILKITLPMRKSEVAFCQQGLRASNEVGTLTVKSVPGNHVLEPNLSISNEGIIGFHHVMSTLGYRNNTKERVDQARVRWTTQKLPPDVLDHLKNLLEVLITPFERNLSPSIDETSASKQVNEDKAKLLQKCEEMIESISGGKIVISSAFVKNQALKQLQTAKSIAMQADPSPELVEVTVNNVEKICQMYKMEEK